MKYIFLIVILLLPFSLQSTNQAPNSLKDQIIAAPKAPEFTIVEYFSLESVEPSILHEEWYAFLTIKAPQKKFWLKYHVYLSTASKTSEEESPTKVECQGTHNELHTCYISHKQINAKEENLRVEMVFQEETVIQMKIEINKLQEMKIGEQIVLQRSQPNFTRFFRIDLKDFTDKFDFIKIELAEQFAMDEYTNSMGILSSLEQTPPDYYRYNTASFPYWDNREMILYQYDQLQQAECITILVGIVDLNTYRLTNKVIKNNSEVQKIEPNTNYYEIVSNSKSYRIDIPERSSNKYYLFQIKIQSLFTYSLDNAKINGKSISKQDLEKALLKEGSTKSESEIQLWLNSTITSFQFTLFFTFGGLYSLYLSQFDVSLIVLPQRVIWSDNLSVNQTQYLFIVINTKSGAETINLQIQAAPITPLLTINFRNCVAKTVAECNQFATSNNETKRSIGMPVIKPKVQNKKGVNFYRFDNATITKYQMQQYVYQSIIIVEVHSVPSTIYALSWYLVNQIQTISENELVQATLEKDQIRIFTFTIFDASNLQFARVHFIHGTTASFIVGSTQLLDIDAIQDNTNTTISEFDGSVTFTNLVSKKTYYIYVASWAKDIFELTLTYAYNLDDQLSHPITYLTLSNQATNQLILQPLQILFLEIRTNSSGLLTVENSRPLKICLLFQLQKPKSHEDMKSAKNCQTFSTVNHFYIFNFQNTGKFYVGIENQRSSSSSISLTTQTNILNCPYTQMGRTKYLLVNNNNTEGEILCVNYPLSEKGEVEILVDINNPRLQGIAHPQVKIGEKWQTIMNTNLLLISADDIDTYCEQSYDHCFLIIQIDKNDEHKIFQEYIAVTASYTNQPLALKEGLAHHSHIRPNEVKHFKYPIYSDQAINSEVQTQMYDSLTFYAQLITSDQKFKYPKMQDFQENNQTNIYKSVSIGYFYPATLTISSQDLKQKCVINKNCYVLYSVYSNSPSKEGKFVFQVTQTINTLTSGNKIEKYLEKDSKAYFNYKNSQAKSLLFFTTSNTKDCLKIDIFLGNDGANSQNAIISGKDEVLVQSARQGWYTARVQASQNCFFAIQVSASQRGLKELSFGYANYFDSASGEKKYYMVHNNLDNLKIIASLDQNISGQLILQAMPVTDNDIGDFVKFINNQLDITKKSKLNFVWSDINHLTMRKNDSLYCKDCYICIQAQSTTDMNGYLTIPSSKESSLYLNSYISYDILLKGETFTWIVVFQELKHDVFVAVQAGELDLTLQNSFRQNIQTYHLKYDKTDPQKNVIHIQNVSNFTYENIKFIIKAVQNLDYSIYSKQKNSSAQLSKHYVEIGRPNYVYAYPGHKKCFNGQLSNEENQFMLTTSLTRKMEELEQTIQIKGYLSGKQVPLKIQATPSVILFSFEKNKANPKTDFKICFENSNVSDTLSANFMYLGNLNYFPENSVMHLRGSANLTFMSQGRGTIEIDECASRSSISLNRQYKDIKSMNSKVNSRRMANNLISFNQYGTVYMHVDSKDYVALSWKNIHQSSHNGFGYDIYLPSTFRTAYDTKTRDITIKIKPLEVNSQATFFPKILEVNYKIYVASEELDLYNAMNCEKGKFMYWIKHVSKQEQINKEATSLLNNIADLKNLFKGKEYVLIIVKAEAIMQWETNNFTQSYRFYYPYQQLMLSQFSDELSKEDQEKGQQTSQGFSTTFTVIFFIIAAIIVAILTYIAVQFMKRRMWRTGSFAEQEDSHGTELQSKKVPSGSINSGMK